MPEFLDASIEAIKIVEDPDRLERAPGVLPRLRIERVDVTGAAIHPQDDALFGVGAPGCERESAGGLQHRGEQSRGDARDA